MKRSSPQTPGVVSGTRREKRGARGRIAWLGVLADLSRLVSSAGLIGLIKADDKIVGASFDILSPEGLFLVPRYVTRPRTQSPPPARGERLCSYCHEEALIRSRIFSVLSLYPYFGTLVGGTVAMRCPVLTCSQIPCPKEMVSGASHVASRRR